MASARTVAVVDYGMGNLRSVSQAVIHAARDAAVQVIVTSRPEEVYAAERIVLPGQGAMRDCMGELARSGLKDAVLDAAARKPMMGVCVGMQMLLDHSEEQDTPGLGLIPGRVRRFRLDGRLQGDGSRYKVPQMGWNRAAAATRCGPRCRTRAGSISCTVSTSSRPTRATAPGSPSTASALPRRSHAIIFLRRSSIPRRAPTSACSSIAISSTGSHDPRRAPMIRLPARRRPPAVPADSLPPPASFHACSRERIEPCC